MRRSDYAKSRVAHWLAAGWPDGPAGKLMPTASDRALQDLEAAEAAGVAWEPELPEWPELSPLRVGVGVSSLALRGGTQWETESDEGLIHRIARAWNARRPDSDMEQELRRVAQTIRDAGGPMGLVRAIEAALRLGVEP